MTSSLRLPTFEYASAIFGKNLLWTFFNTFFVFFAIYGLGLDPISASLLAFTFAVADATFDIPAGFLLNKRLATPTGMFPWVLIAAPASAVLLITIFAAVPATDEGLSIGSYVVIGVVYRLFFTFVDVPLNASIGRFDYHSQSRNIIAGFRSIASTGAKVAVAILTALLVEEGRNIVPENLRAIAAIVGVISVAAILPTFYRIDRRSTLLERASPFHGVARIRLREMGRILSPDLKRLFAANVVYLLLVPQFGNAFIFILGRTEHFEVTFSTFWLTINIVSSVTVLFWAHLASRTEKVKAINISLIATATVTILFLVLGTSTAIVLFFFVLYSSVFHANALIWSALPDVVDQSTALAGRPTHAAIVGAFAAIGKLTIGAAHVLTGILLASSSFPDAPDVPRLLTLVSAASVVGCLACVWLLSRMRLTHRSHAALIRSSDQFTGALHDED